MATFDNKYKYSEMLVEKKHHHVLFLWASFFTNNW
jgi:hypothetical protein